MANAIESDSGRTMSRSENRYEFAGNDPFDREAQIRFVVPRLIASRQYMQSIREFQVPANAFALWFLGQNGFLLKGPSGPLVGIDLYLSNSCATTFSHLPYRLDRQLPVFIEPEDLDIDVFITTHSHDDHADPETIRRVRKDVETWFVGPFDSVGVYRRCGIEESRCRLIHPGETVDLGSSTSVQATFALPTDATDLNHTGVLLRFSNGLTFLNTGDTAYAERLVALVPFDIDVCAICINGGFHNLSATDAAALVKAIRPRVAIPCHYDMLVNNVGSPEMLRVAIEAADCDAKFVAMRYYQPWLYQRG
ncbi:MAG TPA: MBL fold metallo-hydrolase [Terracidiphilus sp.]|jgi:L-ascorbate 6-phosphate lactonase|nr:MBL fold metallo-hydrolase [Terracidiphilus sp.]